MKLRIRIVIMVLLGNSGLFSQQADSLLQTGREVISRQLEHLASQSEADIDLSELSEGLEHFLEYPLNINDAEKSDLKQLGLLNDVQIKNLIDYRKKYGIFYSIYELKAIDGIGRNTLEKIMPFVVVEPTGDQQPAARNIFKGRHELFLRFQRKLVRQAAYVIPEDSLQAAAGGSFYLGDPNRYYIRYRYKAKRRISMGFTAEKDPGELFLHIPETLSDPVKEQIKNNRGPDFYSFHLEMKNLGLIRSLIIGDFHVHYGQGLVLWTGLSFSGGSAPSNFKRYAAIIKPNTSTNENLFMRGAALRINRKKLDLSIFYSRKRADANIRSSVTYENGMAATSLPEGGYHRTLNELQDKNSILQQHFGGHLSYSNRRFRIGFTAYKTLFDIGLEHNDEPARVFQFRGNENFNAGIDFDVLLRKTNIFGEIGYSINGGWALLSGITHNTSNGSILSILYKEYRKDYQNLLAQADGNRDGNANERGIKLAMEVPVNSTIVLQLYTEHYTYPWLTSRTINIFRGQEHEISLFYKPGGSTGLSMRYKFTSSLSKSSDNLDWLDEMRHELRHRIRFQVRHMISPQFSIKSQAEYTMVRSYFPEIKSKGTLLLLDVFYHPLSIPLKLSCRYALFNTDNYSSRLYVYEYDVLYASSMPAYYGKGFRTYVLISYKPLRWLQLWLRFSLTNFTDRDIISSGTEEIKGNKVPEIKMQCRIKL